MPWKTNYTISDEISLSDRGIVWPDHNRCCFNVVVDLSLASGPEGLLPSDLATADSVFAMGGGLAGLLDVLTSHKIVATFAVPAAMVKCVKTRGRSTAVEQDFRQGSLKCAFAVTPMRFPSRSTAPAAIIWT